MKLVTIKESHNSNDLMILKSRLESEGIHCNLKDQYTSEVLSHIPSMSVKLQVYDSDLKNVKEIMNDMGEPYAGLYTARKKLHCHRAGNMFYQCFQYKRKHNKARARAVLGGQIRYFYVKI